MPQHYRFVLLLSAAIAPVRVLVTQSPSPKAITAIDGVIRRTMAARQIPGAAVAVIQGDAPILLRGYGFTDLDRSIPVTPDTRMQIAGLTNPFTAIVVQQLARERKLHLDDHAAQYLSWLPARYSNITIRQLLTQTSGVAPELRTANVDEFDTAEFRRRLEARTASSAPGTRWEYANTGYMLLAMIVEAITGRDFGAELQARIFRPARMTASGYRVPERMDSMHAIGYDMISGTLTRAPHAFTGWGNSGIESSARDLAHWIVALHRGLLLDRAEMAATFASAQLADGTRAVFNFRGEPARYGMGWFLGSFRGVPLQTHGGTLAGFSAVANHFPSRRLTVIVLCNGKQGTDRQSQAEVLAGLIADRLGVYSTNEPFDTLPWRPSWPGTEEAVVQGDMTTPGTPFEFWFRMPAGYWIAPHTHPGDAHLSVMSGTFRVGHGAVMDTIAAPRYRPGETIDVGAGMAHYEGTAEKTVIRVRGIAPWGITFVDPATDPMRRP